MPRSAFQVERSHLPHVRHWLKSFGYLPNVRRRDLQRVDCESCELADGARMLQIFYGRDQIGEPDGIIGQKTLAAMYAERCGHPDLAIDPELSAAAPAGSGSWPTSCHETGILVSVDTTMAPTWLDWRRIFERSAAAYAMVGVRLVLAEPGQRAHIRQSWRYLSGSTIGLAEFNSQSCGDSVFNYRDPGFQGNDATQQNLDLHELGHNMNCQHTNGGIMNPSINQSRNAWVEFDSSGRITYQDVSYPTLARFFGGRPLDPVPAPPPPPPPPSPPPPPVPSPVPWRDVLEILIQVLQTCPETSLAARRRAIRGPGPLQRAIFEERLRRHFGMSILEWWRKGGDVMRPIYAAAESASDDEIDAVIRAADDPARFLTT